MSEKLSSASRGNERFVVRRRRSRRRALIAFCVLSLIALSGFVWGLWQSSVRISRVEVYGADASFADYARSAMRGSYFGIIPRDSTFFFPASQIRADIITAHPDIAAVSMFRDGLTGLSIKLNDRVPIARWCPSTSSGQAVSPDATRFDLGNSDLRSNLVADCYFFDASGFVYATSSTAQPLNSFIVYGPSSNDSGPVGSTLLNASKLPAAFDFARELTTFGSSVTRVVIRGDEVDDYLTSGTRVTYVLGNEQNAFTALVSARENFNLADGSLEYIDLRFDRKIYLKKKEAPK